MQMQFCFRNFFDIKRSNWIEPILHPTSEDFEERIIYHEGMYLHKPNDIEAKN